MSNEQDEELELNGLIKHLEEAFSNMDGDYFCKVHGQAVESALDKLHKLYKPEPVQYVVELSKSGQISESTGEEFVLAQINGVNLFYGINPKVIREASLHALQVHCKALGHPSITIEQITFVEA